MLWSKCKKLSPNKSIHVFSVSNGSARVKIGENDRVNIITPPPPFPSGLEELFPENKPFSNDN